MRTPPAKNFVMRRRLDCVIDIWRITTKTPRYKEIWKASLKKSPRLKVDVIILRRVTIRPYIKIIYKKISCRNSEFAVHLNLKRTIKHPIMSMANTLYGLRTVSIWNSTSRMCSKGIRRAYQQSSCTIIRSIFMLMPLLIIQCNEVLL